MPVQYQLYQKAKHHIINRKKNMGYTQEDK